MAKVRRNSIIAESISESGSGKDGSDPYIFEPSEDAGLAEPLLLPTSDLVSDLGSDILFIWARF